VEIVQKVVAYIVRDGQIIVFRHGDDESLDESGIQVPAGTIKPGELPADAVMREAHEETGLPGLRLVRFFGAAEYDMRLRQAHVVGAGQAAMIGRLLGP
jgi:8-oxo-dGTP diphosphatase